MIDFDFDDDDIYDDEDYERPEEECILCGKPPTSRCGKCDEPLCVRCLEGGLGYCHQCGLP